MQVLDLLQSGVKHADTLGQCLMRRVLHEASADVISIHETCLQSLHG